MGDNGPVNQDNLFLTLKDLTSIDQLGCIYVKEVVKLCGVPKTIVSLLEGLQRSLGIILTFKTTYHPQMDGQTKKTNKVMKDMFKAYFQDHGASWVELLPLIEFTYNNNYYTTIKMTLYEALYDKRSHSPLH